MPAKHPQKPLTTRQLGRWQLIEQFQERLERFGAKHGLPATFSDPKRQLEIGHYLGLFLFGLLNPAVRTMRGLCAASDLERLQREVCGGRVSLGSFSETQAVIDPTLLEKVFGELAQECAAGAPKGSGIGGQSHRWMIVDSTLWEVLPRMHWALWRRQGICQNAVRLHLSLHLLEDSPARAKVTTGRVCERKAWQESWQAGDAYIGDRYFGQDYQLLNKLDALGSAFVLRLRDQGYIEIEEELALSEADGQANVVRQAWARLGSEKGSRSGRVRLVWVQTPKEVLILVTNQSPTVLSAELVAHLYRQRWQIELFFRWIKCILGCRHWLAESSKGVAIQVYLALIAALLLQLHSGQRPTRRMMERIQLYVMGVATIEELEAGLARELARLERLAKNKKA